MEKRTIAIIALAVGIVLVVALLVALPAVTGRDPIIPLPVQLFPTPTPEPTPLLLPPTHAVTGPITLTPTPTPAWSGDSRSLWYASTLPQTTVPTYTRLPYATPEPEVFLSYVTIQSDFGGVTQTFSIPFPYWELHYTVDPWETTFIGETSSRMGGPADYFAVQVFPTFVIEVRNAGDDSLFREITPPGGLDAKYWKKGKEYDPRPWVEKFYEGSLEREYYFVIRAHAIHSYKIDVMVPARYIGQY
jgi:hypothetical protein